MSGWRWMSVLGLLGLLACPPLLAAAEPDAEAWQRLLARHVQWSADGHATTVDYAGMQADRAELAGYLAWLQGIDAATWAAWPADAQLAFLINAYNAWTVELILTRWPDLESIRDLGSLLRSPWKKAFIPLLGETRSLDDIEHGLIRGSTRWQEPRIHFAVNCASIGCPALRPAPFAAATLDADLDDATRRFLADRTRNRLDDGELQVSPIFKWYREDFERGWRGAASLGAFLAGYADALGLDAATTAALAAGELDIGFTDYDWRLNGRPRD